MAVIFEFICDGCGKSGGPGVVGGMYTHPEPPPPWRWGFGAPIDGPHACSPACWELFAHTADDKIVLYEDHATKFERRQRASVAPAVIAKQPVQLPERKAVTYFIQRGVSGPIKIGRSKDVGKRLRALQTATAERLRILGTTDAPEDEMHRMFAHLHINGEWFKPEQDLLDFANAAGRAA